MNDMTDGERMVWAATYARLYTRWIEGPLPERCVFDLVAREEHETLGTYNAIEGAAYAVTSLREALPGIEDGFGSESSVYHMAAEMLK